jgi:hypothetical protein
VSGGEDYSLAAAQRAAERGELATWVTDFLASPGSDNEVLAGALAFEDATYLGPIQLDLDELTPLAGPDEAHVLVPVDEREWEATVGAMIDRLGRGWEPPPLLVSHHDGRLLIEDGNHRHEALRRSGATAVWAIVVFSNAEERRAFASDPARGRPGRSPRHDGRDCG